MLEFARVRLGCRCRRGLALGLPRLLGAQQFVDLLGFEQPGDPDEVEFVFGSDGPAGAEFAAVEQDAVEQCFGAEGFEGAELIG